MVKFIESQNIKLIAGTEEVLSACLKGNDELESLLGILVPMQWSEFGEVILEYSLEQIQKDPGQIYWWTWLPVHKKDNLLIGSCGYKGEPTNGMVEIGYEVIESYRNKGFATEIAQVLVKNAFEDEQVNIVQAHTLADKNASSKVLSKCGFQWIEELEDDEDGMIWKWELKRSDFEKR